jgi:hypothetical protein
MKNWINVLEEKYKDFFSIKESEILISIPFEFHNDWDNFMRGKTCPLLDN